MSDAVVVNGRADARLHLNLQADAGLFAVGIERLLFGVTPTDPLTFAAASILIWAAGAAGCLLPAVRASRIDPVVALRSE